MKEVRAFSQSSCIDGPGFEQCLHLDRRGERDELVEENNSQTNLFGINNFNVRL